MSEIKIYIDEDAMDNDLVAALRCRGVTVVTALDAGLTTPAADDAPILRSLRGSLKKADLDEYRKHLATKYR